jgi:FMN phosphatase YigB (HAD superfamily)
LIRHLLLDLDGTLIHVNPLPLRVRFVIQAAHALRGRGYPYVSSAFAIFRMVEAVQEGDPALLNETRAIRAFSETLGIPAQAGKREMMALLEWLFPQMERYFHPVPGAREFVEWASTRYELTLATNPVWPIEIVNLRLKWAGIDPAKFRFVSSASNMHATKPSLDYYRELLAHIGGRAEESLLVGDHSRKDLPATGMGLGVVLLRPGRPLEQIRDRAWKGGFEAIRDWLSA